MESLNRHISVGYVCPNLIPERSLYIIKLVLNQYGIQIEYTIAPALPTEDIGLGQKPFIQWLWWGVDNAGGVHTDAGGAYGPSSDGLSTNGVLTLVPLPPPEATSLRITLNPRFPATFTTLADTPTCTFEVDLTAIATQ